MYEKERFSDLKHHYCSCHRVRSTLWQAGIEPGCMKKILKYLLFVLTFGVIFFISFKINIHRLEFAPMKLMETEWDDSVGTVYVDLDYENENGNTYNLYVPANLDKEKEQYLILYIHGGSFNSGAKGDGDIWCRYYASKGYLTASVDYTLQNQGKEASLFLMNEEIENAVKAIKKETEELGYRVTGMAASGVSAGGTLAMNLAYGGNSAIPVRFVFELAAPTYFVAEDWGSLMKSDNLGSEEEFYRMMTGKELSAQEYRQEIKKISPTCLVGEDSVPTLIGYGLKDHCVPADQKEYLIDALEKNGVSYDYVEFPHSNHLLYGDLDKMQTFMDLSLEYCKKYFQ